MQKSRKPVSVQQHVRQAYVDAADRSFQARAAAKKDRFPEMGDGEQILNRKPLSHVVFHSFLPFLMAVRYLRLQSCDERRGSRRPSEDASLLPHHMNGRLMIGGIESGGRVFQHETAVAAVIRLPQRRMHAPMRRYPAQNQ